MSSQCLFQRRLVRWTLAVLAATLGTFSARADNSVLTSWQSAYPNSLSDDVVLASTGARCALCHFTANGGPSWNAYGWKIRQGIKAGQSEATAIANAAPPDSDLDPAGWINELEITLGTQPGWTPGSNNTRYNKTSTLSGQPPPTTLTTSLDPVCGLPISYCTAGTTSSGCVPAISGNGTPSGSAGSGFSIAASNVEGQQSGLIFYGVSGPLATPWGLGTSFQCVKAPFERGPIVNAGGTAGACDGVLAFDWNQFVATHPAALGVPFSGGETVWAQAWFRDPPAPKTTNLSDGLSFTVCP